MVSHVLNFKQIPPVYFGIVVLPFPEPRVR